MKYDFSRIKGNDSIKRILSAGLPRACIIEGAEGSGKHEVAKFLEMSAICLAESGVPCGKCNACKKFLAECHADFTFFDGAVPAKELRPALQNMNYAPIEGVCRVYVFDNAELLNPTAQNILLKSLEEPPPTVMFLLITVDSSRLLQTVRSRCLMLSTSGESVKKDASELKAEEFLSALFSGSMKAADSAFPPKTAKDRRERFGFFTAALSAVIGKQTLQTAKNDPSKLPVLLALGETVNGVLSKISGVNVNLNLWQSIIIVKCFYIVQNASSKLQTERKTQ